MALKETRYALVEIAGQHFVELDFIGEDDDNDDSVEFISIRLKVEVNGGELVSSSKSSIAKKIKSIVDSELNKIVVQKA